MRSNKKSIFYLICIIFLFLLSGCTVIGNTNLPTFKPVDDSENVIAFYKGVRDYYSHNTGNCIVFFNTKTEKVTKKEESTDLSKLTVAELKEMAKEKGIEGISTMKKADLISALKFQF